MQVHVNPLDVMHTVLRQLPIQFRENVCNDLEWSIPTFYMKMRQLKDPHLYDDCIRAPLNKEEIKKIIPILKDLMEQTNKKFEDCFNI